MRVAHVIAFSVIVAFLFVSDAKATECFTPRSWQPKRESPMIDVNRNYVEDSLEGVTLPVDVVVSLNRCAKLEDLNRLAVYGLISTIGKYVTVVFLNGVERLEELASDPVVAFVGASQAPGFGLDVSNPAVKVRGSADYSPNTVEDQFAYDGTGVNIAIMDSGVDDGVHESLSPAIFGVDCGAPPCVEGNPDDQVGHGTHVAAIALGTGGASGAYRGIAPGAGLIDISVADGAGAPSQDGIYEAMEEVMERRLDWAIDIVNMSLVWCDESDGTDALSVAIDRMVSEGLVVTVCGGNASYCGLPDYSARTTSGAAAESAITVANSNDMGDVDRTNDDISANSLQGTLGDPQKPDVAAPGERITSARWDTASGYIEKSGCSMATPLVAGCAALLLQAEPDLPPRSLKKQILELAQDKGDAGWDPAFGNGVLDCFSAVNALPAVVGQGGADIGFVVFDGRLGWPPSWASPEVFPTDEDVRDGVPNEVNATVTNFGTVTAVDVQVALGVYGFSNSVLTNHICTETIPFLAPGANETVSCAFTPELPLPGWTVEACLTAEAIYGRDTNLLNNRARHCVDAALTASPAEFRANVANPRSNDLTIELRDVGCRCGGGPGPDPCPCPGWRFSISHNNSPLAADDCPQPVTIVQEPISLAAATRTSEVFVSVIGTDGVGTEHELSGFSVKAKIGCRTSGLRFTGKHSFDWAMSTFSACPVVFDVTRGTLPIRPDPIMPSRGDFSGAVCLDNDRPSPSFSDTTVPTPGNGFWYLTRAGGPEEGSYNASNQLGSRDDTLKNCP